MRLKTDQRSHEFTGIVEEVGSSVKTVKKGDQVVSPFTLSCGECFYCKNSFSSRCDNSRLFGTAALDGAQAEYVRMRAGGRLSSITYYLVGPGAVGRLNSHESS